MFTTYAIDPRRGASFEATYQITNDAWPNRTGLSHILFIIFIFIMHISLLLFHEFGVVLHYRTVRLTPWYCLCSNWTTCRPHLPALGRYVLVLLVGLYVVITIRIQDPIQIARSCMNILQEDCLGPKTNPLHFGDDLDNQGSELRSIISAEVCSLWLTHCLVLKYFHSRHNI